MTALGQALKLAAAKLGIALSDDQVTAMEFAANTYLGRESNEGEKLARRKVAVDAIRFAMRAGPGLTLKEVDKVIQEAQG